MKFRIEGADESSGADRTIVVDAPTAMEAVAQARSQGVFTAKIIPIATPPAPEAAPTLKEPMLRTLWEYRMQQIPQKLLLRQQKGGEAASYLERIVNEHGELGWEFFRIDSFSVTVEPGCLGALAGAKRGTTQYYVATFRRPASDDWTETLCEADERQASDRDPLACYHGDVIYGHRHKPAIATMRAAAPTSDLTSPLSSFITPWGSAGSGHHDVKTKSESRPSESELGSSGSRHGDRFHEQGSVRRTRPCSSVAPGDLAAAAGRCIKACVSSG